MKRPIRGLRPISILSIRLDSTRWKRWFGRWLLQVVYFFYLGMYCASFVYGRLYSTHTWQFLVKIYKNQPKYTQPRSLGRRQNCLESSRTRGKCPHNWGCISIISPYLCLVFYHTMSQNIMATLGPTYRAFLTYTQKVCSISRIIS